MFLNRKDYIITDHDFAHLIDDYDKPISLYNIKKHIHKPIDQLMKMNLFYYERYGFVYPLKYQFLYALKKQKKHESTK